MPKDPASQRPAVADMADRIISAYPEPIRKAQLDDRSRIVEHASLIIEAAGPEGACMDVGGGIGFLSPLLAACGMRQTLVDDFRDDVNEAHSIDELGIHASFGVRIVNADASSEEFQPAANQFDVVTTFDSIEHWHRSPKLSLHRMRDALRPGGWLIIGVPNCVNLRKRLMVPMGFGKWTSMSDWYERPQFRGHVREPEVDDLRYIARDLGLVDVRIFGRNWSGYQSRHRLVRTLTPFADAPLRALPSLCSDIYMMGRRNR